jgi:tetratricopeptide (TPR) repeat protein
VPSRGRELALLAVLAAPFALSIVIIHPAQGLYRDWDDFAAAGEALSLVSAWLAGQILRASPRFAWLALAASAGTLAPAVQWLANSADVDRGLARVAAFMREPPPRTPSERGKTWDYLGVRNFRLGRLDASAEAFSHAVETAPSPRILLEWGTVEVRRGNLRAAEGIFRSVTERSPEEANGWAGLMTVAGRLGERDEERRAAEALLRLRPGDALARRTLESLDAPRAAP